MKRPHKILFGIALTVAGLLLVAAIALPYLVDADVLRPKIESQLAAALGRHVSLGPVKLSLWGGLALRAESLRIGEPLAGEAAGALLVTAGPTSLKVALLPLLRKDVDVRSITARGLTVSQDGRPLASDLVLASRVHVFPDGKIETEGTLEGSLTALAAAPRVEIAFTATLFRGTLELPAFNATVGPMRIEGIGRGTDVYSTAPRLSLEGSAKLKRTQVTGKFDAVAAAGHPSVSFDLDAPLLDAGEILAAFSLLAGHAPAPAAALSIVPQAVAAEIVPAAGAPSFLLSLDAKGVVRAGRCVGKGLELTNLQAHVSLARSVATFDAVTFALYGGTARGSLTARPFEPKMPFTLEQTAERIAIGPLIKALAPAEAGTVDGRASLAVRLTGEAGGPSILPSVNGAGRVAIEEGKIASFGVVKQVQKALEIAGAKGIAKDETPFDRLSADFNLVQGTADTKNLVFRSPDLNGDGAGTVGWGGAVKLDVLASFSKQISDELVAKTHALSIRQGADGRISVPLQIRGTIQAPRVQVDLSKVINEGVLKELKKEGTKSLLKKLLGR